MIDTLKVISLFLAVWFAVINAIKTVRGENIPWGNMALQAAGVTAFVYLQWLM